MHAPLWTTLATIAVVFLSMAPIEETEASCCGCCCPCCCCCCKPCCCCCCKPCCCCCCKPCCCCCKPCCCCCCKPCCCGCSGYGRRRRHPCNCGGASALPPPSPISGVLRSPALPRMFDAPPSGNCNCSAGCELSQQQQQQQPQHSPAMFNNAASAAAPAGCVGGSMPNCANGSGGCTGGQQGCKCGMCAGGYGCVMHSPPKNTGSSAAGGAQPFASQAPSAASGCACINDNNNASPTAPAALNYIQTPQKVMSHRFNRL